MSSAPPPDAGPARPAGDRWPAGPVTRLGTAASAAGTAGSPAPGDRFPTPGGPSGGAGARRPIWWFAGAAGAILIVGLVLVLVNGLGEGVGRPSRKGPPADSRPPLARACPPPTAPPASAEPEPAPTAVPAPPTGARTVDEEAGISYAAFGAPWESWSTVWRAGTLRVPYKVGQHFVTEAAYNGVSDYHASILSAAVPAADNDALALNLECVGRRVAADVRTEYYPQPNTVEMVRDGERTLGGRRAWVSVFRLRFSQPGLRATDELAAVACIDVGRPTAAVLYVSIPGTHRHLDWVVDAALDSVRPV
ncbi:hypothetical protein [Plantactinospora sp. GCM10030261]|uniref:hypothetical protein n=1 Tax=Plantactinospora sp. GCM10030261 TaxID=3273420 RepID=UPI00360FF1D9